MLTAMIKYHAAFFAACRMKERPSFQAAFGPAGSKLTLASALVPALLKAQLASITGWY
jgi:hypothetical protein